MANNGQSKDLTLQSADSLGRWSGQHAEASLSSPGPQSRRVRLPHGGWTSPTGDRPEEVGLHGSKSTVQYHPLFRPLSPSPSALLAAAFRTRATPVRDTTEEHFVLPDLSDFSDLYQ
ncbi:hypothetical protein GCM10010515_03950 [Streptomyces fructofermentans]|uniref:Uncharacterized protein n=1 Tax=Streptomyces fructofermentans TaxID=152141 RepID=A0A918K0K8_9ACTN|nr:hypothetical protein GCM10010515_03950 [Streptomyces fructofermentans]